MKQQHVLSAQEILASDDIEHVDVEMPEWKLPDGSIGVVRLRSLSNDQLVEYTELIKDDDARRQGNVMLIYKCAVNEDGTPLFTKEHVLALQKKAAKPFNRLARAALTLNGVTSGQDEVEKAKNA
jgi:hypothetical protein